MIAAYIIFVFSMVALIWVLLKFVWFVIKFISKKKDVKKKEQV